MLTTEQTMTIKKGYLSILMDALKKRNTDNVLHDYKLFLQGYSAAIGVSFEELDNELDKRILSLHFIKQELKFHTDKELYKYCKKELKAIEEL